MTAGMIPGRFVLGWVEASIFFRHWFEEWPGDKTTELRFEAGKAML